MKIVTEQLLEKLEVCQDGTRYAKKNLFGLSYPDAIRQCIKDNKLTWANWGIVRVMNRINKVKYAVYAAKQVLKIYEDSHPNDMRPRSEIKAIERWIKNPIEENRRVADYVFNWVSTQAAVATAGTVIVVDQAALTAAFAAHIAYTAHTVRVSDYATTWGVDSVIDATDYATKIKIIKYGIRLLRQQEKEPC